MIAVSLQTMGIPSVFLLLLTILILLKVFITHEAALVIRCTFSKLQLQDQLHIIGQEFSANIFEKCRNGFRTL